MKNLIRSFPRTALLCIVALSVLAGVEYHSAIASWFTLQSIGAALAVAPFLGATAAISANCQAVTNSLLVLSGQYGPDIFARAARTRPIIRLQGKTRGQWENGIGTSIGAVTFERSLPDTLDGVWASIAPSDGDSANACLPPTDTAGFGQTVRTFGPQHMAINTDDFCIRDIQFDWQFAKVLGKITAAFSNLSEWVWASRYTTEYVKNSGHHLTLNLTHGLQDDSTTWSGSTIQYNTSNPPTAVASQKTLKAIYGQLWREGADLAEGLDENTRSPVFTAIMSPEMSDHIIRSDPAMASDNRYAYTGTKDDPNSPLLVGLPVKARNYGGFMHEIDPYVRKFVLTNGAYVQVPPLVKSSTTKGNKWEMNPAYAAAPYEEIIIWHAATYKSLAVNTVTNPAPGWNFDPHSWMGQFEPRNIPHRTCNPDSNIIFWRALFADASEPGNPAVGYSILSLSCPGNLGLADCNGVYSTYAF